ncbi:hypothetical protein OG879_04300 [Streptomyces caniferus]|uniref:hypothetical protein n=1 Tax=Streptomyces caniferus TaxID=285557 RepID=UPI002E2E5DFD|nr:hypothetical protein [Streptomyces caniferus]
MLRERIARLAPDRQRLLHEALPALEELVEGEQPLPEGASPNSRRPRGTGEGRGGDGRA